MEAHQEIRERLIRGGVNNLGAFGYPAVRPENILTDPIYSAFFKSSLQDALNEIEGKRPELDAVIRELIGECVGLGAHDTSHAEEGPGGPEK